MTHRQAQINFSQGEWMTLRSLLSLISRLYFVFSGYLSLSFTAYQSVLFSLVNTNFNFVYQGKHSSSLTSRV